MYDLVAVHSENKIDYVYVYKDLSRTAFARLAAHQELRFSVFEFRRYNSKFEAMKGLLYHGSFDTCSNALLSQKWRRLEHDPCEAVQKGRETCSRRKSWVSQF
jgi:hypothetical protein